MKTEETPTDQESSPDFKPYVKDTYLLIIKGILGRIALFEMDSILNFLIRQFVATPENADQKLTITDKFYLTRLVWKAILELLYETYLPQIPYEFTWTIEITPYTIMLCELSRDHFESAELELQKKIMGLTDAQLESDFKTIEENLGFEKLGLKDGLINQIPPNLLPASKKDQFILFFRLMNFPPLGELAIFTNYYNAKLKKEASELSVAFPGIDKNKIQTLGAPTPLHYSYFHIDHETFSQHGLNGFQALPALVSYTEELNAIRNRAEQNKDKFKDTLICPCCGKPQRIDLPAEILQYKYLLENQPLAKKIGFIFQENFTEAFKESFSDSVNSFLPNINRVDNPDCLILVEGDSEEASIPLLAFRKRLLLFTKGIRVHNSKSKEKLYADFLSERSNYPKRKIICLLDSDAVKEKNDIERLIKDHKNMYGLVFIENGTYEDIFALDHSIKILNELYPEGEPITSADFEAGKDFLTNVKKFLFQKKKAQFDKVLFAKKMALTIDIEDLPREIIDIFDMAESFTADTQFIKK